MELKLSDMFVEYGEDAPINLDLTVKVYNITKGHNPEFAKRSTTLDEYETFVAMVRENEKSGLLRKDAIIKSVKKCQKDGILKEFLKNHSSEVINMLLDEWDMDVALAIKKEEGIEEGLEKGREEIFSFLEQGYSLYQIKEQLGLTQSLEVNEESAEYITKQ
jgi:hypothetical protein